MDSKDVYIKRMEAAVLQAGAAISKLKVENANLKNENEQLKKKIESMDLPSKITNRAIDRRTTRPEITERSTSAIVAEALRVDASPPLAAPRTVSILKSLSASTEKSEYSSPPDNAPVTSGNNFKASSSSLCKVKPIPDVTAKYIASKSRAMSSLALGESILRTDEDESVHLPLKTDSIEFTPLEKKQVKFITKENKMPSVVIKDSNKAVNKSPEKDSKEQTIMIKDKKKTITIGPEKGWDTSFTAGCYSYKKYYQKNFEIKPSLPGLYFTETKKSLLPNDSVELLIANTSENNFRSIGKFLRKFSPDIISKHLNDHLRHISYDTRWLQKTKNDFDSSLGVSECECAEAFLPSELLRLIDQLVTVVVSMIARNPGDSSHGKKQFPFSTPISSLYGHYLNFCRPLDLLLFIDMHFSYFHF